MSRISCLVGAVLASRIEAEPRLESAMFGQFVDFIREHRQGEYGSAEEHLIRYAVFKSNLGLIDAVNSLNLGYELAINKFSDMTPEEFSKSHGYQQSESSWQGAVPQPDTKSIDLQSSVDWEAKGAVTGVKDQGKCGSCWSFSTTGAIEGAQKIGNGVLTSLSEQQFVECALSLTSQLFGCLGGVPANALAWAEKNDICTESSYPYQGWSIPFCKSSRCTVGLPSGTIAAVYKVENDENSLMKAVAGQPVAISVDASPMQQYHAGILTDCSGRKLDHAVLLVGYDAGYWKVKNSWGLNWGESGYIRLSRDGGNNCLGLQQTANYVVVNSKTQFDLASNVSSIEVLV